MCSCVLCLADDAAIAHSTMIVACMNDWKYLYERASRQVNRCDEQVKWAPSDVQDPAVPHPRYAVETSSHEWSHVLRDSYEKRKCCRYPLKEFTITEIDGTVW